MNPLPSTPAVPGREEVSWVFLAGTFIAAALAPLGSTMIAVALPSIGQELGVASSPLTQWLVSVYLIVSIAALSPGGKLGDNLGHRRTMGLGMVIYGAGSIVGFFFATLPSLVFARVGMAIGSALIVPACMATIRNRVPIERRPRTFGLFGAVMGMAAAAGPLLGGELTAWLGWRSVFIANIPLIAIAFAVMHFGRPVTSVRSAGHHPRTSRFDVVGSALLGLGLALIVVSVQTSSGSWIGLAGALLLVAFVLKERNVPEPVLDLSLFTDGRFVAGSAVIGLQNLAMYALLFQLPIFLEDVRGAEAGTAGRTLVWMMIAMIIFSPIGGRISERIGARLTVFAGCLLALAGLIAIGSFNRIVVVMDALPGLLLLGAGLGLSNPPSQAASMSAVDRSRAGMAGGAISTIRYIGGVIGISTLGYVLGRSESGSAIEAHTSAIVVYAVALALAALCSLFLPGLLKEEPVVLHDRAEGSR